ncbi:MAG: gamma-glutamyltransferase, partial [Candidatus Hydrogenedentales bacterium]
MRLLLALGLLAGIANTSSAQEVTKPGHETLSDPTRAGRSMAMSTHGMIATAHPLATLAGLDILRAGGTAADAAVAAAAVLAVVEPMMTGLGGDAFLLYYDAETREVHALNGSGRSPQNLPRSHFSEKTEPKIETNSWESVTVPGAADAYVQAVKRFGALPLQDVFAPAIRCAEEGFPVTEVVRAVWLTQVAPLRRDEWAKKVYLVDERPPRHGQVLKKPN